MGRISNMLMGGGDHVATYIDAISAIDTTTSPIPTAVTRNITIAPPGPPFVNGMKRVLLRALARAA